MADHSSAIHALLFAEGGALTFVSLAKALACPVGDVRGSLDILTAKLLGSGLSLILSDTEAALAIAAQAKNTVEKKMQEEYDRDVGEAGLEVLAILLYEGKSTRASIDYIRGVNSSSSIRNLLVRGLIERTGNPKDSREYIYMPTTEMLAHLGITRRESLPEYATISPELAAFQASEHAHDSQPTIT